MRRIFRKFSSGLSLAVITFLAILAGSATGQSDAIPPTSGDIRSLELGKQIERELSGGAVHIYNINLAAGQFVRLVVEQRGIDVVATLIEPGGRKIVEADSPNGTEGTETVTAITEVAGKYQLEVRSLEKDAANGRYMARVEELRAATTEDRERVKGLNEAERLAEEGERLFETGKYVEAIGVMEKSLALQERFLGADSISVARLLNNLATLYDQMGDYERAEKAYQRAITIGEKTLGAENPDVAGMFLNLATMYQARGEYVLAEPIYRRSLLILEKALGTEHPVVAQTLGNLSQLYLALGDWARAESLSRRSLAIREKVLGAEHQEVVYSLIYLAAVYIKKGDSARAEPLLLRAVAISEKTFGLEHPETANALNNLAYLYEGKGDYIRAESLYRRALEISEKAMGREHPMTARFLINLSSISKTKGDYARAESLLQRAVAAFEKNLGNEHPDTAVALNSLAVLYEVKGDYEQAVKIRTRSNNIREYNLGIILAAGSENQKQVYISTLADETNDTVSLHVRHSSKNQASARLALTTILRRKGRVLDVTSNQIGALRRRLSSQDKLLLEQLIFVRSQLAALIIKGLGNTSPAQYQATIAKLQSENERLESLISTRSAEFRAESQPVTIEKVRAAIPNDAALVEIMSYRAYDAKVKQASER
ncbi:MAG TPA: tetratricopeptide repeat protein, partial [Pyrinomonadaceae bacterium]